MQSAVQFNNVSKRYDLGSKRAHLKYLFPDSIKNWLENRRGGGVENKDILWALKNVSFEVSEGEMLGLIGPNGAGKTTTLSLLAGIISPTSGDIRVRGRIGALIKLGAGFHPDLSGRENVYLNGSILGLKRTEIDKLYDKIVEFAELGDFMETPVKRYSSGMYVRLGFSVAVHINPEVLLVDEILSVGDIAFQSRCINRIGEIRGKGSTILFVSHNMHHIASFCDRVVYLNHGRVRSIGNPGETLSIYTSDLMDKQTGEKLDGETDIAETYGTGKLMITGIHFLNEHGEEIDHIRTGQPLLVRLDYQCQQPVTNPLLDVVIRDAARGNMFQATNRDFNMEFGVLSGEGSIDIFFKKIVANNQVLSFFFTFWNSDHTENYDWKRNFKIRVAGNPMSSGRVLYDCEFTVRQKEKTSFEVPG